MKYWFAPIAVMLTALFFTNLAFSQGGGQGAGNGGGGWKCINADKSVRWIKTFDLFEAEHEWDMGIQSSEDAPEIQARAAIAALPDTLLLKKILGERLDEIIGKMPGIFVPGPLPIVTDDIASITPSDRTCKDGTWERVQLAIYWSNGKLEIDKDLYNHPKFSKTDRAALLLHEALYSLLRDSKGQDPNSIRTRMIVGFLLDKSLPAKNKAEKIQHLLDHPEYQNRFSSNARDGKYSEQVSNTQALRDYFFARIQSIENPLALDADTKRMVDYIEKDKGSKTDIMQTQPISVNRMREVIKNLPAIDRDAFYNKHMDCVRYLPFAMAMDPEEKIRWVGFFAKPQLFDGNLDLDVSREEWSARVIADLDLFTLNDNLLQIQFGTILWEKKASETHSATLFRTFGKTEILGWNIHKNPSSANYWQDDWLPTLFYCKIATEPTLQSK